jgi:hypothetical protein
VAAEKELREGRNEGYGTQGQAASDNFFWSGLSFNLPAKPMFSLEISTKPPEQANGAR